jgi:cytochrome P450
MITRPEAQQRLREEIARSKGDNGTILAYDTLAALPFLDAVVLETMRL